MKKSVHVLCLMLIFGFTTCAFAQFPKDSIVGKWKPIQKSGGRTGGLHAVDPEKIIEFTPDCRYLIYKADTLYREKTYHFIKSTSIFNKKDSTDLLQTAGVLGNYSFKLSTNKLVLSEAHYHGFSTIYKRVLPKVNHSKNKY